MFRDAKKVSILSLLKLKRLELYQWHVLQYEANLNTDTVSRVIFSRRGRVC